MKFTAAVLALITAFCTAAEAQNFPLQTDPGDLSSSAGGTSDVFVRVLGEELHRRLGQPIIVENRPGGAFNIGARVCAESPPDGYTLCMMSAEPISFNPFLFKTLPFDPYAFVPITQFFFLTQMLVVSAQLNVKTIPELVAHSKSKPGTLSYATAAVPVQVFLERWKKVAGIDMVRVPFRGGGEAVTALLSAATPVGFYGIANLRAQLDGQLIHGLMVDSATRSPLYPNIPTIPEATQMRFDGRSWFGLFGPPGMPAAIAKRLQAEIAPIIAQADFRQKNLIERGLDPVASTPEEFDRFVKEDRVLSEQIIKESGQQPQ